MKVVLQHAGKWLYFDQPERIVRADRMDEVLPAIQEAETSGLFAAGFISYEASAAFDSALQTKEPDEFPLVCLGLFNAPDVLDFIEEIPDAAFKLGELNPTVSKQEFTAAIGEIKERIEEGATYQVNYTYRLRGDFEGDPWAFFYELVNAQKTEVAAFVDTGDFAICSASPELFFQKSEGTILTRPMKGTARRGRTLAEDAKQADALRESEKDCAENIMIVDMIRNDIGRIADPGSVEVLSRYDVEKYPTCWQMTSTVAGQVDAECLPSNVFKALFPCASITGAPKAKTMEIIRDIETSPRKIYTGSIGFITPQGAACFNVAIRTALIDQKSNALEFGVGGGIVWDSNAEAEYEETLTKARVLTQLRPDFELLETMLWEPDDGIFLLEEHLRRLAYSSAYFDIPVDLSGIRMALEDLVKDLTGRSRIRLLVARDGEFRTEVFDQPPVDDREKICRVALANEPVDSNDVFLFHKTTHRTVYENARAEFPDCDDVILWNERGEITEGCIANVVVQIDDKLVTPPIECGLLAGTLRAHLLKGGEIEERIITVDELNIAEEIYLINSVQQWWRVKLV